MQYPTAHSQTTTEQSLHISIYPHRIDKRQYAHTYSCSSSCKILLGNPDRQDALLCIIVLQIELPCISLCPEHNIPGTSVQQIDASMLSLVLYNKLMPGTQLSSCRVCLFCFSIVAEHGLMCCHAALRSLLISCHRPSLAARQQLTRRSRPEPQALQSCVSCLGFDL